MEIGKIVVVSEGAKSHPEEYGNHFDVTPSEKCALNDILEVDKFMGGRMSSWIKSLQTVRICPFCQGEFDGYPTYCPSCNKRVIKKGTRNQFESGVRVK